MQSTKLSEANFEKIKKRAYRKLNLVGIVLEGFTTPEMIKAQEEFTDKVVDDCINEAIKIIKTYDTKNKIDFTSKYDIDMVANLVEILYEIKY